MGLSALIRYSFFGYGYEASFVVACLPEGRVTFDAGLLCGEECLDDIAAELAEMCPMCREIIQKSTKEQETKQAIQKIQAVILKLEAQKAREISQF